MKVDLPLLDVFGRGGVAQVQLVRRLPAQPRLPDAHRPLPAGPARPGRLRQRGDRARRGRGGVRPDAPRRRAPLGGGLLMAARVDQTVTSGTFSLDGETFDVDNNVWVLGDDHECVVIDARTTSTPSSPSSATAGSRRSSPPTPTTTTSGSRRSCARTGAPVLLHPADRVVWDLVHPETAARRRARRRPGDHRGRYDAAGAAHPRPRPGAGCFHVPELAASSPATPSSAADRAPPAGRSATWADRRVDPRPAAGPARRPWCTPATATTPRSAPSG